MLNISNKQTNKIQTEFNFNKSQKHKNAMQVSTIDCSSIPGHIDDDIQYLPYRHNRRHSLNIRKHSTAFHLPHTTHSFDTPIEPCMIHQCDRSPLQSPRATNDPLDIQFAKFTLKTVRIPTTHPPIGIKPISQTRRSSRAFSRLVSHIK